MKEASGELSMTAVAVVAIAAIGVVFTTLIWPSIKANITRSTKCTTEICDCYYCEDDVLIKVLAVNNNKSKKARK